MAAIGETLLSKTIEKLVEVGFAYLQDQLAWHTGMKAELQRLKAAVPQLQSALKVAELGAHQIEDHSLKAWLWQLKDAAYEADDVLDELDYHRLQKQVEAIDAEDPDPKVRALNSLRRSKRRSAEFLRRVCKCDPTLKKLREVVVKLDGITARMGDFLSVLQALQQHDKEEDEQLNQVRETGSMLPVGAPLEGRDREVAELVQWLTSEEEEPHVDEDARNINTLALYSIVGHGGMGKTTLSKFVFNDERVQKLFGLKIWVCVSTSFDVKQLLAKMIQSVNGQMPQVISLDALQKALKEKLVSSTEKFLLVLDDVWNADDVSSYGELLAPLRDGKKGSKIVLTTRSDRVAALAAQACGVGKKGTMKLGELEKDAFIPLFYKFAFAGVSPEVQEKLRSIGRKIAERLGGSPLAARSIGAMLNSNLNEGYWMTILHNNILQHRPPGHENLKSILMLSYRHLPAHLRACFAYCGIFPQDYGINKKTLVRMWIGVGLIRQSPETQLQSIEDIGGDYFDELVKRSFFEPLGKYGYTTMHDLLQEVAQAASDGECYGVTDEASLESIPIHIRHLLVKVENLESFDMIRKWHNLRTLVLDSDKDINQEHYMVIRKVLRSLKSLRVLILRTYSEKLEFPDEVGSLMHLRVFKADYAYFVKGRRSSIGELYHLQFLELPYNYDSFVT